MTLLSVPEAAKHCGVKLKTMHAAVLAGKIKRIRGLGGADLVRSDELTPELLDWLGENGG